MPLMNQTRRLTSADFSSLHNRHNTLPQYSILTRYPRLNRLPINHEIHPESDQRYYPNRIPFAAGGGDIDLLIETRIPLILNERVQIKITLENMIGLPVDILARGRATPVTPFQNPARANAVKLIEQPA